MDCVEATCLTTNTRTHTKTKNEKPKTKKQKWKKKGNFQKEDLHATRDKKQHDAKETYWQEAIKFCLYCFVSPHNITQRGHFQLDNVKPPPPKQTNKKKTKTTQHKLIYIKYCEYYTFNISGNKQFVIKKTIPCGLVESIPLPSLFTSLPPSLFPLNKQRESNNNHQHSNYNNEFEKKYTQIRDKETKDCGKLECPFLRHINAEQVIFFFFFIYFSLFSFPLRVCHRPFIYQRGKEVGRGVKFAAIKQYIYIYISVSRLLTNTYCAFLHDFVFNRGGQVFLLIQITHKLNFLRTKLKVYTNHIYL